MRPIQMHGHTRPLTQIRYNREGDLLFSCARDKSACVWFSGTGERLGTYDGHNGAIFGLDVDSQTSRLMTASADQSCKFWDLERGLCLTTLEFPTAVRSVQYALGDRLALVLTDTRMGHSGTLNMMTMVGSGRIESQVPLQSVVMPGSRATVARWGNLNKTVYTGHEDGSVMVWDAMSGKMIQSIQPHTAQVMDIQFSTDMSYFITASKDCRAKLIDSSTLQERKVYQSDRPLNSASPSPTFEQVILGGGQEARDVTTTSARAGRFEICFHHRVFENEIGRLKGHFSPVNTLAFHPNGRSFASGAEEGYVKIYQFDDDYFEFNDF